MTRGVKRTGRRQAGRPRNETSRKAILDASFEILLGNGLKGFSIDAVSTRAGVPRSTIYRWWPSKGLLAFESFREAFGAELRFAQSEDSKRDMIELVRSLASALSGDAGRLAASIIAEAQQDPALQAQFLEEFSNPLRERSASVLRRGIVTGRFRHDLDVDRVIDAFVGATYLRLLFGLELDFTWADALADTLLRGCVQDDETP